MRWMRSRWTVVALVPACFLTSFAIVSALRSPDDSAPAEAQSDGAGEGAPPPAAGLSPTTTGPAEPDTGTTTGANGSGSGNQATTGDDGERGGPPPPPAGTIAVDYGRWEGMFEISGTEIVPEFGRTTVTGQFHYLGGVDCQVGFVELRGRFYDGAGRPVGTGLWESIWATGDGAEVPQREPLYLEFYGDVVQAAEAARIRFSKVECL